MKEQELIEKLRKIEALYAGAVTAGEKAAAGNARERILKRLHVLQDKGTAVEYRFSMSDMWAKKLFTGLLRRYDLKPYCYHGQRYTTVMVRVPKKFVDDTLWPEFQELNGILRTYLDEITERLIKEQIHGDSSEAELRAAPIEANQRG